MSISNLVPRHLVMGHGTCDSAPNERAGKYLIDHYRRNQQFFRPATIEEWMIVVFERQERYNANAVNNLIRGFGIQCERVG
jgi:hypothetical protein